MTLSGIAGELLSPTSGDHNMPAEGWQQWKQRDEQVILMIIINFI